MDGAAPGKRILVCGGRTYPDRDAVFRALDRLHRERGISVIIEGGSWRDRKEPGADGWARDWALERGVEHWGFAADWVAHGDAAGPIRNREMIELGRPDGVVAFPGWKGTRNMITQAERAGVKVWRPIKEDR